MFDRFRRLTLTLAALGAVAVGAAAIANAASSGGGSPGDATSTTARPPSAPPSGQAPGVPPSGQPPVAPQDMTHGPGEALLTGDTADKVKRAALEKVPGARVIRVETDSDPDGSAYEAHLQKSDGSFVTVEVDKDFQVVEVEDGFGPPPPGIPQQ
jgi:hypothetical protein